jgi:hypothetical protein
MALAAFAPTTAQAVTFYSSYNFDFSDTYVVGTTSATSTIGNSITFRSTTDPLLKVKATAWSINKNGTGAADDVVNKATLAVWSGGLGVQNMNEDGSSPNHSMDNSGLVDFVLLQFDYDVDINNITTGWVSGDSDASLRVGSGPTNNPSNWNTTPALDGKKVYGSTGAIELNDYVNMSNPSASMNPAGDGTAGTRSVNSNNLHGMMWLLSALYGTDNNDFFKLDALNVTVFPTIPEPSTWMTMILGFGFVGQTLRRRKAPLGKGSASLA